MAFWGWSRTANNNATSDGTAPWPEGMAPSQVNDSARAMMARIAEYRDDNAAAITTGGTSTAYTASTFQVFDSLAHMNLAKIVFVPHVTNTGACTLNIDGQGAWALRAVPGVDIPAGTILPGTPYAATFYSSSNQWILHGFFGNPYNVPIGGGMDYWGASAPNSSFAFPSGQAISRTTYAALFAIMSTTYGTGDGSTTFNLPDKTGRVSAMKEASGTRLTNSYYGDSTTLGTAGGSDHTTLVSSNLPPYTPAGTITNGAITTTVSPNAPVVGNSGGGALSPGGGQAYASGVLFTGTSTQATSTFAGTAQGGSSIPLANVPPLIICNYIIRII